MPTHPSLPRRRRGGPIISGKAPERADTFRHFTHPARRRADYTVVVCLPLVEHNQRPGGRLARGLREEGSAESPAAPTAMAREGIGRVLHRGGEIR